MNTNRRQQRRSLSECRDKPCDAMTTPPIAVRPKKKTSSRFDESLLPYLIVGAERMKLDGSDDETGDESGDPGKHLARNSLILEDADVDMTSGSKQEPVKFFKNENGDAVKIKSPRRPCIRISQPPGGRSSIIF